MSTVEDQMRASFSERYGVREMKRGDRNVTKLFRTACPGPELDEAIGLARPYPTGVGKVGGLHPLFDHDEIWGRDGWPFFLVAHPYQVNGEALYVLAEIEAAGFSVLIHGLGWYGRTTIQVIVEAPSVADWPWTPYQRGVSNLPIGFNAREHHREWLARGGKRSMQTSLSDN